MSAVTISRFSRTRIPPRAKSRKCLIVMQKKKRKRSTKKSMRKNMRKSTKTRSQRSLTAE